MGRIPRSALAARLLEWLPRTRVRRVERLMSVCTELPCRPTNPALAGRSRPIDVASARPRRRLIALV